MSDDFLLRTYSESQAFKCWRQISVHCGSVASHDVCSGGGGHLDAWCWSRGVLSPDADSTVMIFPPQTRFTLTLNMPISEDSIFLVA